VSLTGIVQGRPDPLGGLFPLVGVTPGEHAARLDLTSSKVTLLSDFGGRAPCTAVQLKPVLVFHWPLKGMARLSSLRKPWSTEFVAVLQ